MQLAQIVPIKWQVGNYHLNSKLNVKKEIINPGNSRKCFHKVQMKYSIKNIKYGF